MNLIRYTQIREVFYTVERRQKLLARKNDKKQVVSYENSIKKSNELSMAKLSHGLTLQQMQLLAYAIYSTQQDGKTEFRKADFEKIMEKITSVAEQWFERDGKLVMTKVVGGILAKK